MTTFFIINRTISRSQIVTFEIVSVFIDMQYNGILWYVDNSLC